MTHYIACPVSQCEGEIALALGRDGVPELDDDIHAMQCSEGCVLDNCQQDAVWNLADDKAHEWEVADAEAIVEASAERDV
jgi:hypothetical protein